MISLSLHFYLYIIFFPFIIILVIIIAISFIINATDPLLPFKKRQRETKHYITMVLCFSAATTASLSTKWTLGLGLKFCRYRSCPKIQPIANATWLIENTGGKIISGNVKERYIIYHCGWVGNGKGRRAFSIKEFLSRWQICQSWLLNDCNFPTHPFWGVTYPPRKFLIRQGSGRHRHFRNNFLIISVFRVNICAFNYEISLLT